MNVIADYTVCLFMYIHISCICGEKTATHLHFGQQLLG